jgi:hypothetical protein
LWEIAAEAVGDALLARLWREIYPLCAAAGQLKNDLRELDPTSESYGEDERAGTTTAVTIRLRQSVDASAVRDEVVAHCRNLVSRIVHVLRHTPIDDNVRLVLEGWLHLQFENGLHEQVGITRVSPTAFLGAVGSLAENIDFFSLRKRMSCVSPLPPTYPK